MNKRKVLKKVLGGSKNVAFNDMDSLVQAFGFRLARTSGGHYIYQHPNIPELVNIQN